MCPKMSINPTKNLFLWSRPYSHFYKKTIGRFLSSRKPVLLKFHRGCTRAFKKCFQVGSLTKAIISLCKISRLEIAAFGTYPRENSLNNDGRFLHTEDTVSFSTAIVDEFSF